MGNLDIKFYLARFLKHLPLFMLVAAFVSVIGVAIAYLLPSVYRSQATILVQSPEIKDISTVRVNANEQIQILQQRLLTRQNLLDLAEQFKMFPADSSLTPTEKFQEMRAATSFQRLRLGARRRGQAAGATAFIVSFQAKSAGLAQQVTNELVTQILNENREFRDRLAEGNRDFFEQDVDRFAQELSEKEAEILEFKSVNSNALPGSLEFRRKQQVSQQERLTQLRRQEVALVDQERRLRAAIENPELVPQTVSNRQLTPEERQLNQLKIRLRTQSAILSGSHPNIVSLKARIANLEEIIEETAQAAVAAAAELEAAENGEEVAEGSDQEGTDNRVSATLRINLEQLQGRLEFTRDEIGDVERNLEELQAGILATPNNELQLARLNREKGNIQKQYNQAQLRLNEASTAEQIEDRGKGQKFEMIEPPVRPDKPESPNRVMIAGASVGAGMGLAFALVVLLELLNRSIRRPVELTSRLDIQPFGTVPYIKSDGESRRKRFFLVLSLLFIAIAVPAFLYAVHYYYLPIDLLIDRLSDKIGITDFIRQFF